MGLDPQVRQEIWAHGTVATAVLFSSSLPAMFGTFVKYQFQRTYDAILAAPVDTETQGSDPAVPKEA